MFKKLHIKNEIQEFQFVTNISENTKNFKSSDEIYRVSFKHTKEKFKNLSLKKLNYEKRKFNLAMYFKKITYNNIKDLFVKLIMVIIGFYSALIAKEFLFLGLENFKQIGWSLVALGFILGICKLLSFSLNNTNILKKYIIIIDAIINALDELIEEKEQKQNTQTKTKNSKNKNVVKPKRIKLIKK